MFEDLLISETIIKHNNKVVAKFSKKKCKSSCNLYELENFVRVVLNNYMTDDFKNLLQYKNINFDLFDNNINFIFTFLFKNKTFITKNINKNINKSITLKNIISEINMLEYELFLNVEIIWKEIRG